MTRIDRRTFLGTTAGAAFMPGFLARAFGSESDATPPQDGPADRAAKLAAAWKQARARGKPLLVLVVPTEQRDSWARGELLGALLNHGGDGVLQDLALCELACATSAEVRAAVGDPAPAPADRPEPLMLLVEPPTTVERARLVALQSDVTSLPNDLPRGGAVAAENEAGKSETEQAQTWQERMAAHERASRACVDAVAKLLHEAVAKDVGQIAARADVNRAALTPAQIAQVDGYCAGGAAPSEGLLLQAAAVVRMAALAPRRRGDAERLLSALAGSARAQWVTQPVPGARWASSDGCGMDIEGEKNNLGAIACGMGFVPPLGRRFLYFYVQEKH